MDADNPARVLLALIPAGGAVLTGGAAIVLLMGAASARLGLLVRLALGLLVAAMVTGLSALFVAMGSLPWALTAGLGLVSTAAAVAGQFVLAGQPAAAYTPRFDRALLLAALAGSALATVVACYLHLTAP